MGRVCVWVVYVSTSAQEEQKKALSRLKLELQVVVSHLPWMLVA